MSTTVLDKSNNLIIPRLDKLKNIILKYIYENPGTRYREILKLTGTCNGVLEYHLKALERYYKIINVDRCKPKTTGYYPLDFPRDDSKILNYIGNCSTVKRVIFFILDHGLCTFNQIVEYTNKAPSTISWHLKRLRHSGIITSTRNNRRHNLYKITNEELMIRVLYKCRSIFSSVAKNNQNPRRFELV